MSQTTPIITLTTDFGYSDAYVAQMKGAILRRCDRVMLVDITHGIAPQDILSGSIALERAIRAFPPGTIHLGVVDPGVGSNRKLLVADVEGQIALMPDNGLITWSYRNFTHLHLQELLWQPVQSPSHTFHGRDILAPVAAMIAAGQLDQIPTAPISTPVLLDAKPATLLDDVVVIHIDAFGNLMTNAPANLITANTYVNEIGPVRRHYAEVQIGDPVALIGSSGLLEIAVRNQNAAAQLNLGVGSKVRFRP